MEIKIDIFLKQDGATRLIHEKLTENDIIDIIRQKIENEERSLPHPYDKNKAVINISIDQVII